MKKVISLLLTACIFCFFIACDMTENKNQITNTQNEQKALTEEEIRQIIKEEFAEYAMTEEKTSQLIKEGISNNKIEFIPEKSLYCPQGESFKMYGLFRQTLRPTYETIDEHLEITITSFKAKMLKEADILNTADYINNTHAKLTYFPYLYQVDIAGKMDPKYAEKSFTVSLGFPVDIGLTFYDIPGNNVAIAEDGSFSISTRIGTSSIQDTIYIVDFYAYEMTME